MPSPEIVPYIVPPTYKCSSIPTPPSTIRAPVSLLVEPVVLLIVTTPLVDTVAASVPNEALPPLIVPVVVILLEPLLMDPNPEVIEPPLSAPTDVIFVCDAVCSVPAILVAVNVSPLKVKYTS